MIHLQLEERLREAVRQSQPEFDLSQVIVRPCADPRHGDYQCPTFMAAAKALKANPRQLAQQVLTHLRVDDICQRVDIAGAGFINFRIAPTAYAELLRQARQGSHPFHRRAPHPRTVVVDFSSPNVAKPMHVGHIRSTFLGDCLARVLRALGHRVITDNHIGDWGTQFGKLIVGWKSILDREALKADPIAEMERLYRLIHVQSESDPEVLNSARLELVRLQAGDPENLAIWREMIKLSEIQFASVYQRLGIQFDHTLGESFYNPQLKAVVQALRDLGIAQESEGAQVVFFEHPELKSHPAIIQKSDGASNYATTDLATLSYRLATWSPDEIVYVTDGRQQLHFKQIFAIFRRWHPNSPVRLAHVWFGSILGEDGKPFKTRSGETVKLIDLLDEAEERAFDVVSAKSPDLDPVTRRQISRVVGLGAIKYADLLPNRQSDYIFSWDKMLALNGNTAPYLLYAYTRIRSIFRKEPSALSAVSSDGPLALIEPQEIALMRHLATFGLVLEAVADDYRPNYLCNYLYDLAGHFTSFYESCPVLKAEEPARESRLALCDTTARIMKQGLELLGLETTEVM